jgi:hypothetical protein
MSLSGSTADRVALSTGRFPAELQLLCDRHPAGWQTLIKSKVRKGFGTVTRKHLAGKPHRQDSTGNCPLRLVSRSIHSSSTQYDRKDFVPPSLSLYRTWWVRVPSQTGEREQQPRYQFDVWFPAGRDRLWLVTSIPASVLTVGREKSFC